jgi:membrane protease YdiL (CAAX protease family)
MSDLPEEIPHKPEPLGERVQESPAELWPLEPWPPQALPAEAVHPEAVIPAAEPALAQDDQVAAHDGPVAALDGQAPIDGVQNSGEPPVFHSFTQPRIAPPVRIPHLGHLGILAGLALVGLIFAGILTQVALSYHLFGISTTERAVTDIHYTLGSEAILYLITFAGCLIVFPLIWHKGFFAGIAWHGQTVLGLWRRLIGAAFACFLLALLNGWLLPGPSDSPIDRMFRAPGAAWLLFGFGVTIAPFFEEIVFRGFLLPALCTACDWLGEKMAHKPAPPLGADGQPQWSRPAMVIASLFTSLPFAGIHAAQTGYSWGPLLLLVIVSLVLCGTRLVTRSLAASVLVHASYNFMLFSTMLFGTDGFRHLERM